MGVRSALTFNKLFGLLALSIALMPVITLSAQILSGILLTHNDSPAAGAHVPVVDHGLPLALRVFDPLQWRLVDWAGLAGLVIALVALLVTGSRIKLREEPRNTLSQLTIRVTVKVGSVFVYLISLLLIIKILPYLSQYIIWYLPLIGLIVSLAALLLFRPRLIKTWFALIVSLLNSTVILFLWYLSKPL